MKCKRMDEFHIIGDRRYFTYEMSLNYENRYYNSTPTERTIYVFCATTKDTGLEKYT
jgi:hypothetical protein